MYCQDGRPTDAFRSRIGSLMRLCTLMGAVFITYCTFWGLFRFANLLWEVLFREAW